MHDLNKILAYLKKNKLESFHKRTKKSLKKHSSKTTSLDDHLSKLSREGFIRSYLHPSVGFNWDNQNLESDQKTFYSVTDRGIKFLMKGGY
jgi:hypothetical protein